MNCTLWQPWPPYVTEQILSTVALQADGKMLRGSEENVAT